MKAEVEVGEPAAASADAETGSSSQHWLACAFWVCAAFLFVSLLSYGYIGVFTRYVYDDFCAGRNLTMRGFWGSQVWTYFNHSGRFSSYFIRIGLALIGHGRETSLVPAALLISWLAATAWTLLQYGRLFNWPRRWLTALVLSELLVFGALRTAPDPGQSFYWQAGNITYTLPIILVTVFLGLLPRHLRTKQSRKAAGFVMLAAGFVTLIGAGTSETNAVFQCALILAAIVVCRLGLIPLARQVLPVLYMGFGASALATLVVVVAPGNAVREAGIRTSAPALAKTTLLLKTAAASAGYMAGFLRTRPLISLALLVVPLILGWFQHWPARRDSALRSAFLGIASIWAVAFLLIFSAILPGMYAFSSLPPERALFVVHWSLLLTLVLTGFAIGWLTSPWGAGFRFMQVLAAASAVALVLPWSVKSARDNFSALPVLRRYAAEWDNQDAQLRLMSSNGHLQVTLPWNGRVASNGIVDNIGWISDDPTDSINKCTADYYGIKSLRVEGAASGADARTTTTAATP